MDKINLKQFEVWFICGSQHLYGEDTLKQVAANAQEIVKYFNDSGKIAVNIVWKPTVTTPDEVSAMLQDANMAKQCVGVITWMHTFSPARMWINGLKRLQKPLLHLHTQANRDIPWSSIDMDFMNLNQAAHGDREFGYICTRLKLARKVVVGYWQDLAVQKEIDVWGRVAAAWADSQNMKIARIGDNMREVAVTEGNKVSAQIEFGYSVNGYGVGDVIKYIDSVSEAEIDSLVKEYKNIYTIISDSPEAMNSIREAAKQEIGMRAFLEDGNFSAFTTTFENLYGLHQLPGLASQRLMADGYGFGAEGDWKTAALTRTMKVMAAGLDSGVSFMEDYTYHLEPGRERVLGAHMLEVCPSIADGKATLEVHPLGIGGKADPARLVFNSPAGPALNASMIDLGDHFRLIVNEVEAVAPDAELPNLPVARTVWIPKPDLATAARRWIEAGGAHHSVYTQALSSEFLVDFATIAGIELIEIK
ncbi:MAG: L-arabinose isomerase [Victivallales bacterium]|nr:L-arabinose isomerase [Victivallales bacterium]